MRCLLVPALMVMLGQMNWWMPHSLERVVPQLNVEGAHYFAARDRALSEQSQIGSPALEAAEPPS